MPLRIAIVGAGPAGCMLARLIQQAKEDVSVTIFESEAHANFRSQGGTLDLHEKTGQAALKAGNLFAEFTKYVRYDGEAMKMCDKDLLCYIQQSGASKKSTTGRPEIDRPKLRELLFNSLEEGTVVWNRKLQRVDENLNLHFANGKVEKAFDLIVGADGAWSHVRPLVSDAKPFYSGVGGHTLYILDAATTQPELYDLVNRGTMFAWSNQKTIVSQQMGDGGLNVYTWSVRQEDWQTTCGYDVHDAKAVREACVKDYADWNPKLVAFTQVAEDEVVPRNLYMLPIGHRWEHMKGVTLIGDAAHVMTPFAGEGVNLALADSLALSKAIISAAKEASASQVSTLDQNVLAFEQDMFKRSKPVQQLTYDMMRLSLFEAGAIRSTIERYLLTAIEDELGYWLTKLVATPLVYAYFAVFKMIW